MPEPPPDVDTPEPQTPRRGSLSRLVLLPAALVLTLVLAALVPGWLRTGPDNVDAFVADLERGGHARWQAAAALATALNDPQRTDLKQDPVLAERLVGLLQRELDSGDTREEAIRLRVYLCRLLGEFRVPAIVPVLVEAAGLHRDPKEAEVRRAAVEAIAVFAGNTGPEGIRSAPGLVGALVRASESPLPELRASAAFALGVVGGSEAETRLERMLADGHPDVRYNAATGLARHGNLKSADVLLEMLDPQQTAAALNVEQDPAARPLKRTMVHLNALRSVESLAAANPRGDFSRFEDAVRQLQQEDLPPEVRVQAAKSLECLDSR
jgi:hypothetical protein